MTLKEFFHELNSSCSIWRKIYISLLFSAAVLVIDELDLPSKVLLQPFWIWIILVALCLCCIFMAIDKGIIHLFALPSVNVLDKTSVLTAISSAICLLYSIFSSKTAPYKFIAYGTVLFISIVFLFFRYLCIYNKRKSAEKPNTIDLKDLYEGEKAITPELPLLFDDNDNIDYDLLNHEYIVDGLYQAINHCHSKESFTFGLEGPWGSGKTTIINKVKKLIQDDKSNGLVLLDDFDPWLYGNQESMLIALYDKILSKMNIRVGRYQSQKLLKALTSTIADTSNTGKILGSVFLNHQSHESHLSATQNALRSLLEHSVYRYVIFIDNLDRADTDNIVFIFRIIATFFDLPNIIYVLSYDKERVCKILQEQKQIDPGYLDKIIQASYQVPIFTKPHREKIIRSSMLNLLSRLGVPDEETEEYADIIDFIIKKTDSIRSFKRFLNSIFATDLIYSTYLSKRDLLALETIRFFDYELYQYVYSHKQLFISIDRLIDEENWLASIDTDKFNREAKEAFVSLFSEKPYCMDLLCCLFPTVERYKSNMDIISRDYYESGDSYKKHTTSMAICSARFFDLYFHSKINHFALSILHVQSTIRLINKRNPEDVDSIISQTIKQIPDTAQKEWFEQFELHLDTIIPEKRDAVVTALIRNWNTIANCYVIFALNAQERAAVVILRLLSQYNNEQFASVLNLVNSSYRNFLFVHCLTRYYRDNDPVWQKKLLEEQAYKMGQAVIEQEINLFDDEYYLRDNAISFAQFQNKSKTESTSLVDYLKTIVTPQSIYRFLLEMVSTGSQSSSGDDDARYLYYIHPDNFTLFDISTEEIDQCLKDNPATSKSQQVLADMYQRFKEASPDQLKRHENSIYSEAEITFSDI